MFNLCTKLCMFNSKKRHLNGNYEREQPLVLVIRQGLDVAQQIEEHPLHSDAFKGSFSNSLLKFQQLSTWEKPRKLYCLPSSLHLFLFFLSLPCWKHSLCLMHCILYAPESAQSDQLQFTEEPPFTLCVNKEFLPISNGLQTFLSMLSFTPCLPTPLKMFSAILLIRIA